jgi:hypothetical protein
VTTREDIAIRLENNPTDLDVLQYGWLGESMPKEVAGEIRTGG